VNKEGKLTHFNVLSQNSADSLTWQ